MPKQIFVNLPVNDLPKSIAFYEALGFAQNPDFSNDQGAALVWSEEIFIMLLTKDFYQQFLKNKQVADTQNTSAALLAFTLESKEAVQTFVDAAKANGGDAFPSFKPEGVSDDMMFGFEVLDPDGNQLEPLWMNPDFNPQAQ